MEGINFTLEKCDWKKFEKNNVAIALNVLYADKETIYILLIFQNITQIVKSKLFFYDSKWRRMVLSTVKKLSALLKGTTSKHKDDFFV